MSPPVKDPHDPNTLELTLTELEPTAVPAKRGRPGKHASAAAKQKAYRERQKAQGLCEVKRYVRDVREVAPLHSDIIDLSEVRGWGGR